MNVSEEIMNAVDIFFLVGFLVCLYGFVQAQVNTYRDTTYTFKGSWPFELTDENYRRFLMVGVFGEKCMISGFLFAVVMGIIQVSILGSWMYLIICLVTFMVGTFVAILQVRRENRLRREFLGEYSE